MRIDVIHVRCIHTPCFGGVSLDRGDLLANCKANGVSVSEFLWWAALMKEAPSGKVDKGAAKGSPTV